jgi:predicted membrane protein
MSEDKKRFTYLEGNKATLFIVVIGLFFWNLSGEAEAFIESILSDNIFTVLLLTIYFIITGLGGLFLIFVLINDVVDSLFESKNKDNPNYKIQKTVILSVVIGALVIWFFAYFEPRQECLKNITLSGTSVYTYTDKNIKERFKSRDDALDYCMAQRWDF